MTPLIASPVRVKNCNNFLSLKFYVFFITNTKKIDNQTYNWSFPPFFDNKKKVPEFYALKAKRIRNIEKALFSFQVFFCYKNIKNTKFRK